MPLTTIATTFSDSNENLRENLAHIKEFAETIKAIKHTQIRRYFHEVKSITYEEIFMLEPKLLYGIGRIKSSAEDAAIKTAMKTFLLALVEIVEAINSKKKLKNFKKFMETLVAYHKFYSEN